MGFGATNGEVVSCVDKGGVMVSNVWGVRKAIFLALSGRRI